MFLVVIFMMNGWDIMFVLDGGGVWICVEIGGNVFIGVIVGVVIVVFVYI